MANDSALAFAGLWESWRDPNGGVIETCTILTTKPNALVADVHNRMPAILKPDDYDAWLDPRIENPAMVNGFLKPFDPDLMKKYPVSTRVNTPENDDDTCAREVRRKSLKQPAPLSLTSIFIDPVHGVARISMNPGATIW